MVNPIYIEKQFTRKLCRIGHNSLVYHENVIRAGLRARGRSRWLAATVAMGKMATKSVMRQSYGTKGATARMTMPAMKMHEKIMENLNCKISEISIRFIIRVVKAQRA
jgi:hypothetical protein